MLYDRAKGRGYTMEAAQALLFSWLKTHVAQQRAAHGDQGAKKTNSMFRDRLAKLGIRIVDIEENEESYSVVYTQGEQVERVSFAKKAIDPPSL